MTPTGREARRILAETEARRNKARRTLTDEITLQRTLWEINDEGRKRIKALYFGGPR